MSDRKLQVNGVMPTSRGIAGGAIDEVDAWSFARGTWAEHPDVEIVVEGWFRELGVEYRFGLTRKLGAVLHHRLGEVLR